MDTTDSDQAASNTSSPEDSLRHFDFFGEISPGFFPLSSLRVNRTPPQEETKEEAKVEEPQRESQEPRTPEPETPRRRIGFVTPLPKPTSPLPNLTPPEENMADIPALIARIEALERAAAAPPVAPVANHTITDPADFQRSPYAHPAPLNLTTKSGLHLYTEAQAPLKTQFNGKAANLQPFLNSLTTDVKKFCLEDAVTVQTATGTNVNLLTSYGSFSETDAEAFFDDTRTEQILGHSLANPATAVALAGADDAARLLQAKKIQNGKILFHMKD